MDVDFRQVVASEKIAGVFPIRLCICAHRFSRFFLSMETIDSAVAESGSTISEALLLRPKANEFDPEIHRNPINSGDKLSKPIRHICFRKN